MPPSRWWKSPTSSAPSAGNSPCGRCQQAVTQGWIDTPTAEAARAQADALAAEARQGSWPPQHIQHWTLERVLNLVSKTNP